jgi:hypothetical protein
MNKKNECGIGDARGSERTTEGFKLGRFCRGLASSLRLSLRAKVSGFRFQECRICPDTRNLTPEPKSHARALFTVHCSLFSFSPRSRRGRRRRLLRLAAQ